MEVECSLMFQSLTHSAISDTRYRRCNLYLGIARERNWKSPQLVAVSNDRESHYNVTNVKRVITKNITKGFVTIELSNPSGNLLITTHEKNKLKDLLKLLLKLIKNRDVIEKIPVINKLRKPTPLPKTKSVSLQYLKYPVLRQSLSHDLLKLEVIGLPKLESIYLIGELSLKYVILKNNNLKHNELSWLNGQNIRKSLVQLDLSDNKLSIFPDAIIDCYNLINLVLTNNCIQRLPGEIGSLRNLRYLNLTGNEINFLPASIQCLKLKEFHFHNNPIPSYTSLCPDYINNFVNENTLFDFAALKIGSKQRSNLQSSDLPITVLRRLRYLSRCICGKSVIPRKQSEFYMPVVGHFAESVWPYSPVGQLYQYHFCTSRIGCPSTVFRVNLKNFLQLSN